MGSQCSSGAFTERGEREISLRTVRLKMLWVVLTILSGSGMWDHFVAQYKDVFDVTLPTDKQQVIQLSFLLKNQLLNLLFEIKTPTYIMNLYLTYLSNKFLLY